MMNETMPRKALAPMLDPSHWDLDGDKFIYVSQSAQRSPCRWDDSFFPLVQNILVGLIIAVLVAHLTNVKFGRLTERFGKPRVIKRAKRRRRPSVEPMARIEPFTRAELGSPVKRRKPGRYEVNTVDDKGGGDGPASEFDDYVTVSALDLPSKNRSPPTATNKEKEESGQDKKGQPASIESLSVHGGALFESEVGLAVDSEIPELTREVTKVAEMIKTTRHVFEMHGLDTKSAQDFCFQLHLLERQQRSQRSYENQKLIAKLRLRRAELVAKERRHQETIASLRMDGDWVNKTCLARYHVIKHLAHCFLYLITAMIIDGMAYVGFETIRNALLCNCSQVSWGESVLWNLNLSYISMIPFCFVGCCVKWVISIFGVWFVHRMGVKLHHALAIGFLILYWQHLQHIWSWIVVAVLLSTLLYGVALHKCSNAHNRLKKDPGQQNIIDGYLLECDQFKLILTATFVLFYTIFQLAEKGVAIRMATFAF